MPKLRNKKTTKKLSAAALQSAALRYLLAHPLKSFSPRQLGSLLQVDNNKDSVIHALQMLEAAGSVSENRSGRFSAVYKGTANVEKEEEEEAVELEPKAKVSRIQERNKAKKTAPAGKIDRHAPQQRKPGTKILEGRVDMTRTGSAYIICDAIDSDIFVSPRNINGALHGDTVKVSRFPERPRRGRETVVRKPEGEVVAVIKRATEFFVGTYRKSRKYGMVLPDNPNMPVDIMVPLDMTGDARDGDKVVVRITDWQEGRRNAPIGKITQSLGSEGGNDFEMKKILVNAGFELSHSEEAMAEATAIPENISPQETARRRDFRDILTFTIDPEDAKDFDDALSYQKLDNGNIEIGIHIADVTHYLKPGSSLDKEAYQRSTSVYLADRCLPMLPEQLSNNLCSLVPHQDRLTFSAVFEFDAKEKVVKRWFGKTVIHSAHRFAYEEAQTILEGKPLPELKELPIFEALQTALMDMLRLSKKMRKEREKDGAIAFETDEVRFKLDENGVPLEAYVKERKEAHLLIEDFMLLANKEVAFYIDQLGKGKQEIPFVYRVHDLPDMERVAEFARFAAELGHPIKVDTPRQIAQSFNELTRASRKDDRLKLLEPLAIRTMAKAIYTTDNIGHYGLGFSHYSHFTSPIRRYSDVLAHRILEGNLDGRTMRIDKTRLEEQCKHISNQEKKAADAERESIKLKQAEFISKHIGEEFDGQITGMIDKGFFVALDGSKAEGLVEFRLLDDLYVLDESKLRAHGRGQGLTYKIGDRVRIRVTGVDIQRRQIEMEVAY